MQSIALILLGLLTGSLSGLLGIGGGIILVPALTQLFKVPITQAVGTSLLIIIPAALTGTITHYTEGNLQIKLALLVMVGATAGGYLGATFIRHIPEMLVKRLFAVLMLYIAIRMFFEG